MKTCSNNVISIDTVQRVKLYSTNGLGGWYGELERLVLSTKSMNMYCVCVFVFTDVFVAVCRVITPTQ